MIIETNYKVYAYTNNALQISVLNLFVNLKSRFPNLVTGQITRDSIKKALDRGIKAEQVRDSSAALYLEAEEKFLD